jgi:hypothetical protein
VGTDFYTHLVNLLYGHRISGRMDLILGGGPQLTEIHSAFLGSTNRVSASGRAELRYRFTYSSLSLSYHRFNSAGSGFFAGATSDVAHASLTRPFARSWTAIFDAGYTHNTRLAPTPVGIGVQANSYSYGYVGGTARHEMGRNFGIFFSYQFNDLHFDNSFCASGGSCGSQRQVAIVGLDWHPRPIRLD